MNRKMRRKLKKDPKARAEYNRRRNVEQSTLLMLHVAMLYLRDEKGYGKKRLGDFVEGCVDILSAISTEHLDFKDIQDTIYEETGVKINLLGEDNEHF